MTEPERNADFYDDAEVYDTLHQRDSDTQFATLEQLFAIHRPLNHRRRWFEPACGTARLLRRAQSLGHRVAGFDRSSTMLAFARRTMPNPRHALLFAADLESFAVANDGADFAFCLINTLRHLDGDAALLGHLARMAAALAPGGAYVVGIDTRAEGSAEIEEDVHTIPYHDGRLTMVEQSLADAPRFERILIQLVFESHRADRDVAYRQHELRLRTYSRAQWLDVVGRSALRELRRVDWYGQDLPDAAEGYGLSVLVADHASGVPLA